MPATAVCLTRSRNADGGLVVRLGVPLLDEYLGGRCRPNTVLAVAYDLQVFFTVAGKLPRRVGPADVLAFMTAQRSASMLPSPRTRAADRLPGRPASARPGGPSAPTALAAMRWRQDHHLFLIGAVAFTAATIGYQHRRRHRSGTPATSPTWALPTWLC
jgi:hypothetical protein